MNANREKTSRVMGFVVSVLLHGIFFAGCLALDLTQTDTVNVDDPKEINHLSDQSDPKSKS